MKRKIDDFWDKWSEEEREAINSYVEEVCARRVNNEISDLLANAAITLGVAGLATILIRSLKAAGKKAV